MSSNPTINCEEFDHEAEDLALGHVEEPRRTQLLAHAETCPQCQSLLGGLGTVVDRLLLVAPQLEPPAGFESRALGRLGAPATASHSRFRVPLWAAAVAALIIGAGGFLVARLSDHSSKSNVAASSAIVTRTGLDIGSVQLVAQPAPHVVIAIRNPRPQPGVRHCELQRPDGTWVEVGTWQVADIIHGVWAAGIDPSLLGAVKMRVTTDDGTVLATATFA